MKIEIGDTVQLTASVLMEFRDRAPEIFEEMVANGFHTGKVADIHDDGSVSVELHSTNEPDKVVCLTINAKNPHTALQLLAKQVTTQVGGDSEDSQELSPSPLPEESEELEDVIPGLDSDVGGVSTTHALAKEPTPVSADTEPVVPEGVRMAQWVMVQFLQMKHHGIAQDLMRRPDRQAPAIPFMMTGEDWKKPGDDDEDDRPKFRPVQAQLTTDETDLYNTAMLRIARMLNDDLRQHPECNNVQPPMTGSG